MDKQNKDATESLAKNKAFVCLLLDGAVVVVVVVAVVVVVVVAIVGCCF